VLAGVAAHSYVYEYLAIMNFDWIGVYVVRPGIKRSAALQIKAGMVPVTGQYSVAHGTTIEWKSHVRTTVVDGVDRPFMKNQGNGMPVGMHD
jgi:hypothetical protein